MKKKQKQFFVFVFFYFIVESKTVIVVRQRKVCFKRSKLDCCKNVSFMKYDAENIKNKAYKCFFPGLYVPY